MNKTPWKSKILDFMARERKSLVGYVRRYISDTAERDGEDIDAMTQRHGTQCATGENISANSGRMRGKRPSKNMSENPD